MCTPDWNRPDPDLLAAYIAGSQDAFAALVDRYLPLIYRSALRQVSDPATAEDVTQAVFILLAKKAAKLQSHASLAAWLLQATRFSAADARKLSRRRAFHEQRAAGMKPPPPSDPDPGDLAKHLDAVLNALRPMDRNVIALHFLQQQTLEQVGQELGLTKSAVHHRLTRALERLRSRLSHHGIVLPLATLTLLLAGGTLTAAPVPQGLAASTTATAIAAAQNTLTAGAAVSLAKGTSTLMTIAKAKALAGVAAVVLVSTTITAAAVMMAPSFRNVLYPLSRAAAATPPPPAMGIVAVNPDGTGQYRSIQEAVNAVPYPNLAPVVIQIYPGRYTGRVEIPRGKSGIIFRGMGAQPSDVWLGAVLNPGERGALAVLADDFRCENLTIEDISGQTADQQGALYLDGVRHAFDRCSIIGWHGTLESRRQSYFHQCTVRGSSDIIMGAATIVFDDCDIVSLREWGGSIASPRTAQSSFGFIFLDCRLRKASDNVRGSSLMRPWGPNGQAAFIRCVMDDHIAPEGWTAWEGRENTCRALEFGSVSPDGTPIDLSKRAPWGRQLTSEEVNHFTLKNIFPDWDLTASAQ